MDKIICDLNKTPDLFQRPPQNCPKCGNPVYGQYCQGCALLRKKFKENLFTYCIENRIFQDFQDTSDPSNNNTNVVNALQDPFVVNQDPCKNSSQSLPQINHHCCYGCGDSLDDIFYHQCTYGNSFTYDSRSNLVDDSPNVFNPSQTYSYEFCGNDAYYGHDCSLQVPLHNDVQNIHEELTVYINTLSWNCPTICYNDDDEDYTIAITLKEADNSLSMGDEHLDTILATKSDEFIKSSVENLVPNPKEFVSENFDVAIESFSPSSIPVEDSDSLIEEIDLSFTPNDPMPPGIEEDDYDSERDILILEELLSYNSLLLLKNESFHCDIPSSSHPPAKPPYGHEVSQPSTECPMKIYGRNTAILDVSFLYFYPP
nr:hypothetical protein [Tanacetum cinerariifolium]